MIQRIKLLQQHEYIEVYYMLKSKQLSCGVNSMFIIPLSLQHVIDFNQFTTKAFFVHKTILMTQVVV